MGKLSFNPSANQYTNQLMKTIGTMAMEEWKADQATKKRQEMFNQLEKSGLFGNQGVASEMDEGEFTRKQVSPGYLSGINMDSGMPKIGIRKPGEVRAEQYQQDVSLFKRAEGAVKGQPTTSVGRPGLLQRRQRGREARPAFEALSPEFGGKSFIRSAEGKYRETAPKEEGGVYKGTAEWKKKDAQSTLFTEYIKSLKGTFPESKFDKYTPAKSKEEIIKDISTGRLSSKYKTDQGKASAQKILGALNLTTEDFFNWASKFNPELSGMAFPGRSAIGARR